jgi:hypothetical protein
VALNIVGAGLAGLLAAHAWPQARIWEASSEPRSEHKALLRFRSDVVARLTGIDFRQVTVRKGIWFGGKFVSPSIGMANLYARKVMGGLTGDRSIWQLDPVERWIAPEDFYEQMISNCAGRVRWGEPFDFASGERPVVSTAPLPTVLGILTPETPPPFEFKRASITVRRHRVPGADAFQTIYFPNPNISMYRASITGSLLIVESMLLPFEDQRTELEEAVKAFGLKGIDLALVDAVKQKYGKIVPLPDAQRRALLHSLTKSYGIFSLGRFATWRNILLDDVVQDISVLRRLMRASNYERVLFAAS